MWNAGALATTTASTSTPGTLTWRGWSVPRSATRSTWAMTVPPLLAVDLHQAHELLGGTGIDAAAAMARVDERVQPDVREGAGLAGGDVAEQVREHALRQVIGLDLVGDRELLQRGDQPPVAAHHP